MIRQLVVLISVSTAFAAAPTSLSIQPVNPLLFGQGATQALVVVAHCPDGSDQEVSQQSQFSAAKPSVASVDSSGTITAHASGASSIQATYKGFTATTTA